MKNSKWDKIYSSGIINEYPSNEIINLVPVLKQSMVSEVLDIGCGTGRHSNYLTRQGFSVHGFDISGRAIQIAKANGEDVSVDYRKGTLADLSFPPNSMDFILANHSLEYISEDKIVDSIKKIDSILKKDMPIFVRVLSTDHPLSKANPEDIYGFSHVGFCIKNNLPVHFYERDELEELFKNYKIQRLEHITHEVNHKRISVPMSEWVLFGYKK